MTIFDDLMKTGKWDETNARLAEKFKFRCAYCDKDMLGCVDNHYDWQADHIIPKSKGGSDAADNLALSCRTCNFIKGTWNPLSSLNSYVASQEELIEIAKKYISRRREEMRKDLERYRNIAKKYPW